MRARDVFFFFFFFLMIRPPPRSPLFPYPTLFRSPDALEPHVPPPPLLHPRHAHRVAFLQAADVLEHDIHRDRLRDDRAARERSEEHTSELQSQSNLVCRLLLEKKKNN